MTPLVGDTWDSPGTTDRTQGLKTKCHLRRIHVTCGVVQGLVLAPVLVVRLEVKVPGLLANGQPTAISTLLPRWLVLQPVECRRFLLPAL